ncbi:MAG TPA: malto-oligosyltrehalose synthase [Acetobacteraceae bacterium]|nr:malto-oligosyltrehalose synthase [Acetobacteraceae bacterium]
MTLLRATARLQFHRDFRLDDGAALVPYLARLGISHLYASPLLTARPGSTHGYDIVDHNAINPELGGMPALERLVERLRAHDMGLILDIVPNHMGVGGADNAWWLDVLEWGRASPYAEFFDIDWDPPDPLLKNRLLAPFLGSAYGECLARGELALRFDQHDGRFFVAYFDHRFPIGPRDYPGLLRLAGDALEALASRFAAMPGGRAAMRRHAEAAREALWAPEHRAAIEAVLAAHDGATDAGRERLHRLLERQAYRLAWWRAASDEINWRRFFDINSLAGVRVEVPEVFEATHATVLRLYADGLIDGVRIDHVDGLADPRGYCRKLRRRLQAAAGERPAALTGEPAVLWVEKILAPHERLPADWLTDGTTGYDFMAEVAGLLHDPAGEAPLTALWTAQTGRPGDFEAESEAARRQIVREVLSSEWFATSAALHRVARRDLTTRDYTLTAIRWVLAELLIHFHAYRIYAGPAGISEPDRRVLDWAMARARRSVRTADQALLELVGQWLAGDGLRSVPAGTRRQERLRAMVRFQQLSAPTAAKSIEDTAFYRYGRLLSRNEVGTEPSQFALSPAAFHAANRERLRRLPRALLATATHDHKRGEDTRARLAVLSELPGEWEAALGRWTRLNAILKREIEDGPAPDAADELMLYQTLVAAWPLELAPDDEAGVAAFAGRVAAWQEKAVREAKRRSGWAAPNAAYEQACRDFLAGVLDPARPARVVDDIAGFAARIAVPGCINSLTQTLLRLTSPGVPDLYQGSEFWDFSLVDPDNRRRVDFVAREAALAAAEAPAALLASWRDGRVKQALIARTLGFRARATAMFREGAYLPLRAEGRMADHVVAFARTHEGRGCVIIGTRLPARLAASDGMPLAPATVWSGTTITLPRNLAGRAVHDALGAAGVTVKSAAGRLPVAECLAGLPVALLEVR